MRNLLWFVAGAAFGVIAAHVLDKDPRGHELLADVDSRIAEFTDRVGDAYREQEAKFSVVVEDARHAAGTAADSVKAAVDGVHEAVAAAEESTAEAVEDAKDALPGTSSSESDHASDDAASSPPSDASTAAR